MTSSPPIQPPLLITVRFSNALPDLDIPISSPKTTTVLSLKQLLRSRLATKNRIRLIYQGRLLQDASSLSSSLKPLPRPQQPASPSSSSQDVKGKGKAVDRPDPIQLYLNCSIGDELSADELAEEKAAAQRPPEETTASPASSAPFQRPRPRGFDRLLQAGFTQSEISTLRTQFATINTDRFASDAMPSPDTMRSMEDAWIDSNAGETPSAGGGFEDDGDGMSTVLDILIKGMMIGFFFPLGSMAWLLRQDVWGDKWRIFVGSGVMLSLTVGIVMSMSSDHS